MRQRTGRRVPLPRPRPRGCPPAPPTACTPLEPRQSTAGRQTEGSNGGTLPAQGESGRKDKGGRSEVGRKGRRFFNPAWTRRSPKDTRDRPGPRPSLLGAALGLGPRAAAQPPSQSASLRPHPPPRADRRVGVPVPATAKTPSQLLHSFVPILGATEISRTCSGSRPYRLGVKQQRNTR